MEEIWKNIAGYEGRYEISSLGRVRSLRSGKIMRNQIGRDGYERIMLNNIVKKCFTIHRLVCKAFRENKLNKKTINHINGIRSDNRLENLEWSTMSENHLHKYHVLGYKNSEKQKQRLLESRVKPVYQYEICGKFIKKWKSASEAYRCTGIHQQNISRCCNGFLISAGGYNWKFGYITSCKIK